MGKPDKPARCTELRIDLARAFDLLGGNAVLLQKVLKERDGWAVALPVQFRLPLQTGWQ